MAGEGISREIPLRAYDHLTTMLLGAGSDGGVRREDVATLVAALRKEGRGTEALAADSLFTMVAHVDYEKTNHLNAEHFDRARSFFAKKLYHRGGVISAAELALMSPTLRALVEIGQFLDSDRRPGRIPHHVPRQGMDHVAALLLRMTRPEGVITRDDRDLMVFALFERGRGTEALAVRYFFNFIDHRSGSLVEKISPEEIAAAITYSDEKLLRNKDLDNNGYSTDEVARFSTTAKAFLRVGQMIEAGLIQTAH
ncbi:MAG: hypothetical protein ACI8S6_001737 [Myxococcota bacterium]|jgi:hypothetical protein